MIDGIFVIDATTHTYNLSDANLLGPAGQPDAAPSRHAIVFRELLWGLHSRCTPPDARIHRAAFYTDWEPETLAYTLFTESDVDIAVHHRLRLDSLFTDGLVRQEKNDELAKRWPRRFLCYAGVNPVDGPQACVASLAEQLDRSPGIIGLKVYPDAGMPDRNWRMDDPAYAPLFELAIERGIRVIACHKVVPNGLVPLEPYRIDDLEHVAIRYPQLAFEIVHAGLPPFVDEVTMALTRLPNVYANLEITSAFLERGFGVVADALAAFIGFAGVHKLLYASGGMHFHPQPILEWLLGWDIPDELQDRYRIEPLTTADRAAILGGNYARMAGLEIETLRAGIVDDEFTRSRHDTGRRPPWTHWRSRSPESGPA